VNAAATAAAIDEAVALLHGGELIGLPTETVYGVAADALNVEAVNRIFLAKGRPADHPLIVHLADAGQLPYWARDIPVQARQLAAAFWPGPLTLILKKSAMVPLAVTGGQDTVGVRVPGHPLALALLRRFGSGVVAPSANRFGRISPTLPEHVREELGDKVAMVLDGGPCEVGIESTIVDLSRDRAAILRPGAISAQAVAQIIGYLPDGGLQAKTAVETGAARTEKRDVPRVSGSLAAHYAPATPLSLAASAELEAAVNRALAQGKRLAVLTHGDFRLPVEGILRIQAPADAEAFAHELYARLRQFDHLGVDLIIVETPPARPQWLAVLDRLGRAAEGSRGSADRDKK